MKSLRIVFAGTPEFGLPCLEALASSRHQLVAVYTQPDRKAGRGQKLHASAVKTWASANQIPVFQPENFREESTCRELQELQPDVMIVIAYGLILPKKVLEIPRLGCINVHASLLPAFRGASPIQQAILHGCTETGVTIMQMDAGMDTGDILMKATCEITDEDTAKTLHDKLSKLSVLPLMNTLDALEEHRVHKEEQMNILATYAGKISKEDAWIEWNNAAIMIHNQIRAFNPWPIACTHAGEEILRIHEAFVSEQISSEKPGTILYINKHSIGVATADRILILQQIQFPGGKVLTVSDWLNSAKKSLYPGMILQ